MTGGVTMASSSDQTPFVASFSIKQNGQTKVTVVVKQKEKSFVIILFNDLLSSINSTCINMTLSVLEQQEPKQRRDGPSRPMTCSCNCNCSWPKRFLCHHHHHHHHQSLNREGRWAPQMILQPVFSIFPVLQSSGTCRTPGLSIPWCCLRTSSFVCLVFFPLSLCLARWFWPDLMNGKHDHTTAVCVSLRWSEGLRLVWLPV